MSGELMAQFEKRFPRGAVIQGELQLPTDGFHITILFGPSGCGKTTVLRCLAGLERPDTGRITCGNETWFDAEQRLFRQPQERDIGFLFQEYALFPHRTVAENIAFGLRRLSRENRCRTVGLFMERFQLEGLADRYPHQISGGNSNESPWHGCWCVGLDCCCWTNPFRHWMPRSGMNCAGS